MQNKKTIFILTLISICVSTLIWEKIVFPFNPDSQIYGEYFIKKFNPLNDNVRYILFILIPLTTFLFSYIYFNGKKLLKINEVLNLKTYDFKIKKGEARSNDVLFYTIIFLILLEFFSINFGAFFYHLDFFHEGTYLTPPKNFQLKDGIWTQTFLDYGLWGNFFSIFVWKIFDAETIGSLRFFQLVILLLNKILIVYLAKNISDKLCLNKNLAQYYFVFFSIFSIALVNYFYWDTDITIKLFLVLIFLSVFLKTLEKANYQFISSFFIGLFSSLSLVWYIDIGVYLNCVIFLILVYFFYIKNFKSFKVIILGVMFSWVIFFIFLPGDEINAFYKNTLSIFATIDYIDGMIYPTPFISKDARATRALLFIIITGILLIIFNLDKRIIVKSQIKIFFSFLYLFNILIFKSAILRSDAQHIKTSSGLLLFLLIALITYFTFRSVIIFFKKRKINKKLISFFKKNHRYILVTILFFNFFIVSDYSINPKKIFNSHHQINNLIYSKNEKYLSEDYVQMIDYYKNISASDKCVQIFTNEAAIPYLLDKPTCSKFYSMWISSKKESQEKFISELMISKPKIILYSSKKDIYGGTDKKLPDVLSFIEQNYSLHSNFLDWTFFKIN